MADAPIVVRRIMQIALVVHDTRRAIAFYRDLLGLTLLFEAPPAMAFFDCGGVRLMLSPPSSPDVDHPASILYYDVADVRVAHAALSARGVQFRTPPHLVHRAATHELWMAFLADPDGNVLALVSELPLHTGG